jgi:hypothetical protein
MDLRRLRAGELLAAAGGAGLLASLFTVWYDDRSGFEALAVIDVLLVLLGALAILLGVLQVTQTSPAKPVGAGVLTVTFGAIGVLLVLVKLVVPGDPGLGVFLALASTVAITAGGWLSLAAEYVRGLPPGPEPELRPPPRIADSAQP